MTTLVMQFKPHKESLTYIQAAWLEVVMPTDRQPEIRTETYYGDLAAAHHREYEEIPDDGDDALDILLSEAARL